jgi:hypothetical protein
VLDRLLHPAAFFSHPREVVDDPTISVSEKRAILSSWASDACAVESMPALRQAPGAQAPVAFDEVIDALQKLDHLQDDQARLPVVSPGESRVKHRAGFTTAWVNGA